MIPQDTDCLVLRREGFGGIIFNPIAGVHLELDGDGFEVASDFFVRNKTVDRGFSTSFLRTLLERLGELPKAPPRFVENTLPSNGAFRQLSGPTLVDIQITSVCTQGCPHCYASSVFRGKHIPFDDLCRIFDQCADSGVLQVALGGGDPLLHPDFVRILEAVRLRGMVPNVTTSGAYFTPENLRALRKYCGAVALSLEGVGSRYSERRSLGWEGFCESLDVMHENQIPTVLQVTVSAGNLYELPEIVSFALTRELYGVIFLAFKPVGRGDGFDNPLSSCPGAEVSDALARAFRRLSGHTRVGYDCCLSAVIAGMNENIFGHANEDLEGCSALRGSVGISVNQEIVPCTFVEHLPCGNLQETSVHDCWHGKSAADFREKHEAAVAQDSVCSRCSYAQKCMGGCPVYDLGRCQTYSERSLLSRHHPLGIDVSPKHHPRIP